MEQTSGKIGWTTPEKTQRTIKITGDYWKAREERLAKVVK
jgi:hypothetical protein